MNEPTPITEEVLRELKFNYDAEEDRWNKHGVVIWEFNGRYWLVTALDQAGIDVEFKTIEELELFFKACKLDIHK